MANHAGGATIVLVGGKMTVDTGEVIDSRQAIQGDKWDFTLRSILTRSEEWWEEVRKLVDAILKGEGEGSWALVWAPKTILRPFEGSASKRPRIASVLPGITGLKISPKEALWAPLVIDAAACDARYQWCEHAFWFECVAASQPPSVFVGGHPELDPRILLPFDVVLRKWPDTVVVMPHTPLAEQKADDLVRWYESGRPKLSFDPVGENTRRYSDSGTRLSFEAFLRKTEADEVLWYHSGRPVRPIGYIGWSPHDVPEEEEFMAARDSFKHRKPVVLHADYQITHFIDRGSKANAADLAAACELVAGRFDLNLGLWDLARDPLLRKTVLKPKDLNEPEDREIVMPAEDTGSGGPA